MKDTKYVVFKYLRKFGDLDPERTELYWTGKPCARPRGLTTPLITRARLFKTADDARHAVNSMVNLELCPDALLDFRIGRRILLDEGDILVQNSCGVAEQAGMPGWGGPRT